MAGADLRAGYAARTLPVPVGTPLGGYQPTRDSTGTHDPLEITVIVLDDGACRFSLVLVDLVCVNRDLSQAVRARVRDESSMPIDVWVGASHTHAGPDVGCRPGGGRTPSHWLAEVTRLAADCHREAARRLTPSGIRHAEVPLHGLGSVRNDPTAPHRVSADLLHWPEADGILAVVPVHSTVLPQSNTLVSGDLHGAVRRHLRDSFDGWVAVAPGCAGDVSTRWTRRAQDHDECDRLGELAAAQLLAGLPTARPVANAHTPLGRVSDTVLTLPARVDDPAELAAGIDADAAPATEEAGPARLAETHRQGLDLARARALDPVESVDLSLASARVGDLLLTAVGAEPYLGLPDRLRATHGPAAVALGYTGGYAGYLPDAAAHATPGYEVLASPFRPDAEERALAALAELSEDASDTIPHPAKENHP